MIIKIGSKIFTATINDNPTAAAFRKLLPITLDMVELNNNEKYADLPRSLPTKAENPGNIQAGDLMMYGASTLVVFYRSFKTSYSYTRVGRIDDITGLASALGPGNVKISFETE